VIPVSTSFNGKPKAAARAENTVAFGVPFVVAWSDAAEVFRLGLELDLAKLPSKCEAFFIFGDVPQGKFRNEKAKRILGFAPKETVSVLWRQL
jgi:hypothetical protein